MSAAPGRSGAGGLGVGHEARLIKREQPPLRSTLPGLTQEEDTGPVFHVK